MKLLGIFIFAFPFLGLVQSIEETSKPLKKTKQWSIFSVVKFPNAPCVAVSDQTMFGTCLSSSECTQVGGVKDGNCASGFGVCCTITIKGCGGTISRNNSYAVSPNYPGAYTEVGKTCAYTINSDGDNICQLRLDFDDSVILGTNNDGTCTDSMEVFSPSIKGNVMGATCGLITGQHMYVETGKNNPAATLTFKTHPTTAGDRKWKVRVQQIECEAVFRAYPDCLQYLTGVSGAYKSFNFGATIPKNNAYTICIRQEEGYCSIAHGVNPLPGGARPFWLTQDDATNNVAKRTRGCDKAQIQIRSNANDADIYCGRSFNSARDDVDHGVVYASALPFYVYVTSFNEVQEGPNTGFSLKYTQQPCGEKPTN